MKDILPGLKTKITGWVVALAPVAALVGFEFDPAQVSQFVEDFFAWIAAGYALAGAAIHFFRDLADKA